jgi:hypothetical protein
MPNFIFEDFGVYDDVVLDDNKKPLVFKPLTLSYTAHDLAEKVIFFRVRGDPGTYELTVNFKAPQGIAATRTGDRGPLLIRVGSKAVPVTLNVPIRPAGPGIYTVTVHLGGVFVGSLDMMV